MSTDPTWGDHDISLTGPVSGGTATIELRLADARGEPNSVAMQEQPNPRTALRVNQGAGGDSDFEMPYTPITQKDWSGGRGLKDFDRDASRYADANNADTSRPGMILPAGKETLTTGYRTNIAPFTHSAYYTSDEYSLASAWTPASTKLIQKISVPVSLVAGPIQVILSVKIYNDNSGKPGTLLTQGSGAKTCTAGANTLEALINYGTGYTMTSGVKYWIEVAAYSNDWDYGDLAHITLVHYSYDSSEAGNKIYKNLLTVDPWQQLYDNAALNLTFSNVFTGTGRFFQYRGALYVVSDPDSPASVQLFMNGYRGNALANTNDLGKIYTSLNLTGIDLTGKIVKIVGGPGYTENQNWRVITSNETGANAKITVSPEWNITHTTDTEYVILGCDTWQEVTGHGLSNAVSDVCVADNVVYFCQGEAVNIRRGKFAAGSWTWADEGTEKASFMEFYVKTNGDREMIIGKAAACTLRTAKPAGWANSTWADGNKGTGATAQPCGSTDAKMTRLRIYGEPQRPWVWKEDQFGDYNNGVYAQIPLKEMPAVRSETNGRAAVQSGRMLYFSMGEGIERYYQGQLDDMGPNKDEGLPSDRRGVVADLVAYPGGVLYAAIDAGDSGYSSVMKYNGNGWCEIYRAALGYRIRNLFIENIPNQQYQRLWIAQSGDYLWVPISPNPLATEGYQFVESCSIETGWMYGSYRDVYKFFHSLKLSVFNADATHYVLGYYTIQEPGGVHGTSTYTQFGTFNAGPTQEIKFSETYAVSGVRFKIKLVLVNPTGADGPVYIESMLTEIVTRLPIKLAWPITYILQDVEMDEQGMFEAALAKTKHDQLLQWANSASAYGRCPVLVHFRNPFFDTDENGTYRYMFVEPSSVQPIEFVPMPDNPRRFRAIGRMTLIAA